MSDSNLNDTVQTLTFDYIKSNFFRVIYIDGVMGNFNGTDNIHLVLWNERLSIPKQEVYSITSDGSLGEEIDNTSRDSIIREVEVHIILNKESALSLKKLLDKMLSDEDF